MMQTGGLQEQGIRQREAADIQRIALFSSVKGKGTYMGIL